MFKEFGFIEALPYLCIAIGAVLGRGAGALADAEKAGLLAGAPRAPKDRDPSITAAPVETATKVVDRRADAGEALLRKPVPPERIEVARSRDDDRGDFATSMLVAAATHSTLAGTLAGGSLTGALVGSALTDDEHSHNRSNDLCTTPEDRDSWSDQDNDSCSSSADSDPSDDD